MTSLYYYAACSLFGTFLGVSTVDMFPEFFIENPFAIYLVFITCQAAALCLFEKVF